NLRKYITHTPFITLHYKRYNHNQDLHSFPTRRSSDLKLSDPAYEREAARALNRRNYSQYHNLPDTIAAYHQGDNRKNEKGEYAGDRKSTRLNYSHVSISYAVFCLKKKIYTFKCCNCNK